ncbi:MAG: hypothetical protein UY50_C0002G0029 [Parcubacteria group bacterium GW2011_GWA2_49_9]|nr:MAG: hypothetical protein UY50_C0002G0029 [Parcubacteria group bacterium GW2011_GWA2_49_9]
MRYFLLFFLALVCAGTSFFVTTKDVSAAGSTVTVTLTVNGSAGAVAKPRLFTLVCSDGKGRSAKKAVAVSFVGQKPLPADPEWPAVTVMSPNGNELWTQGEGRTLVWTAHDVPLLKNGFIIDLLDERGASFSIASSTLSGTARNFAWLIPTSLPSGKYKVRVSIQHNRLSDLSDGFFTVMKVYEGPSKALVCGTLGDVTGDKVISSADADRIAVFAANPRMMTLDDFKRADIDVNGVIASADIVQVNQYLTDIIKTFSGCLAPGVSVDLRANGSPSSLVSVSISSTVTLSWTSSGAGRCVLDDSEVPEEVKRRIKNQHERSLERARNEEDPMLRLVDQEVYPVVSAEGGVYVSTSYMSERVLLRFLLERAADASEIPHETLQEQFDRVTLYGWDDESKRVIIGVVGPDIWRALAWMRVGECRLDGPLTSDYRGLLHAIVTDEWYEADQIAREIMAAKRQDTAFYDVASGDVL